MSLFTDPHAVPNRPVWADAALAIAPVVLVSLIGSAVTTAQIPGWYAGLAKPSFNPPNWIFGPVWTTLYVLMAYGVFRVLRLAPGTPGRSQALALYHAQLALNLAWSCVFFGLNSPLGGLLVIVPLWGLIWLTILGFRAVDPLAGNIQWPYLAWVSFATLLNASIWWLNG